MAGKADYVVLPKSERKMVKGARFVRDSQTDERLEVSVHVRRKHGTSGVKGPPPRNLSHAEMENNYGSDASDLAKIADFAHKHGLVVDESSAAKRLVRLSGTVKAFNEAFDVSLGHYEHPDFTYRGRIGSISIPKELNGIITAVLGLDNRPFARPHFVKRKPHPTGEAARQRPLLPSRDSRRSPSPTCTAFLRVMARARRLGSLNWAEAFVRVT